MEDEEGELFNNTYLEELKTGRFSPTHESAPRDSITRDELTRRNSMYPWHLRSSYAPQYADQNLNEDDVLKVSPFELISFTPFHTDETKYPSC